MKKEFINSIIIFLICCLIHFTYSTFPNVITSIISPVNESIWEHFKMLFSSSVIYSAITLIWSKEKNFFLKTYLRSMLSTLILAIIYLPIYYIFGEHLIITLIILFLSILTTEIIINKIPKKKNYYILNIISSITLIINLIIFIYLTYHPLHYDIFYDTENKQYGILNK